MLNYEQLPLEFKGLELVRQKYDVREMTSFCQLKLAVGWRLLWTRKYESVLQKRRDFWLAELI
jgi:hypothetical protein